MTTDPIPTEAPPLAQTLRRGFIGYCPNCGKGKLFRGYLKPVEKCAACGETYGHIRADDGPAWLTILFSGHVFAFSMPFMGHNNGDPDMLQLFILLACITLLALGFLHRAKGMFIALVWRTEHKESAATPE